MLAPPRPPLFSNYWFFRTSSKSAPRMEEPSMSTSIKLVLRYWSCANFKLCLKISASWGWWMFIVSAKFTAIFKIWAKHWESKNVKLGLNFVNLKWRWNAFRATSTWSAPRLCLPINPWLRSTADGLVARFMHFSFFFFFAKNLISYKNLSVFIHSKITFLLIQLSEKKYINSKQMNKIGKGIN